MIKISNSITTASVTTVALYLFSTLLFAEPLPKELFSKGGKKNFSEIIKSCQTDVCVAEVYAFVGTIPALDTLTKKFSQSSNERIQEIVVKAYHLKAYKEANSLHQPKLAISTLNTLIAKFGDSKNPRLLSYVGHAYLDKGKILRNSLNNPKKAIAIYDTFIKRYNNKGINDQVIRVYLEKAEAIGNDLKQPKTQVGMYNYLINQYLNINLEHKDVSAGSFIDSITTETLLEKASVQNYALKQPNEAITTYNTLINLQDNQYSTSLIKQKNIASAYLQKAQIQDQQLKQSAEAVTTYQKLIARYKNSEHQETKVIIAETYHKKAILEANKLKKLEEAIASYDSLITSQPNSKNIQAQWLIAKAYIDKAEIQKNELKQIKAAINTYDALTARYSDTNTKDFEVRHPNDSAIYSNLKQAVAEAYYHKGNIHLKQAKKSWNNEVQRKKNLNKARLNFKFAHTNCAIEVCKELSTKTIYTDWLLGDDDKAQQRLEKALKVGGEQLYTHTLLDVAAHTTPTDKSFKSVLKKAWENIQSDAN